MLLKSGHVPWISHYIQHNVIHTEQMWRVTAKGTLRPLLQVTGLVWMGGLLFSHKRAAVFSSQEAQYDRM